MVIIIVLVITDAVVDLCSCRQSCYLVAAAAAAAAAILVVVAVGGRNYCCRCWFSTRCISRCTVHRNHALLSVK